MKRIKRVFVRVHLILWALFGFMAYLQLSQRNSNWPILIVTLLLTCLCAFYGHYFLLTRYPGKKKALAYWLGLAAILAIAPLIYLLFQEIPANSPNSHLDQYIINILSIAMPFVILSWLAKLVETLVLNTVRKEQLEKQAAEAELYYLKSQTNPHFLFNTLNNIHTLVYKQVPTAPDAVMQLASLMRYMIYESNAPTVALSREISYLKDYISLQQLRYKQSPVVDLKIEGEITTCHIAPLLFIHLLENAYKHSPARLNPGDLKVMVKVDNNTLSFCIQNPVARQKTNTLDGPGGIGLPNVIKRLNLLYPNQHSFDIHDTGENFAVLLKIYDLHLQPHE